MRGGVLLAILVSGGVITDESWSTYDQLGVASGIQDFLICIEMFVAALAHAYAFPPKASDGVLLAILVSGGVITDESWSTYDQLGVASGIQLLS
ncbi:transmembrane protein 184C [Haematococcus lacustris]|uniref:Transmembrane protein 184C n=1 Tax=Haematococcus lacustris TaxID=44745 RepID=A0A699ZLS1_HAELA|nr:transmembrane protein 184C [Haematococcus lacustris]